MHDNVRHPNHYCGKIETIDYIKDKLGKGFIPFCLGNVIKYISRYDKKGKPLEDLEKAEVYLNWAIESMKGGEENEIEKFNWTGQNDYGTTARNKE